MRRKLPLDVVVTLSAILLLAATSVQARRGSSTSLKASLVSKSRILQQKQQYSLQIQGITESAATSLDSLSLAARLRGGSTKKKEDLHAYRLQQQLYLQSRSLQIRQALIQRGFTELQHSETEQTAQKSVDWDCALTTRQSPKSCLYSFDAEVGSKVIAPMDTEQWITLSALNRLRRNDPTKVEPLWHSQYHILKTWFHPNKSPYSLYTHLTPVGTFLSCLLDAPFLLGACMLLLGVGSFLLTFPFWEGLLKVFLMSKPLWMNWHQWGRFVHAALPLKLLLGQLAFKGLVHVFSHHVYRRVRDRLVEWECQILESCVPLTILEDSNEDVVEEEEELVFT